MDLRKSIKIFLDSYWNKCAEAIGKLKEHYLCKLGNKLSYKQKTTLCNNFFMTFSKYKPTTHYLLTGTKLDVCEITGKQILFSIWKKAKHTAMIVFMLRWWNCVATIW